jgi:F-type H+-transporting ATPase subunit c
MSTKGIHQCFFRLFQYAVLGFAFAEATGLFALMMSFLLLYVA